MKEKDIKKEVKLLAKQGYFDDIYQQFGLKYFRNYVSRNYKRKDIRKLEKEGKYFDIYEKYGKRELDYLSIYVEDVENEVGKKRSFPLKIIYNCREKLKRGIAAFLYGMGFCSLIGIPMVSLIQDVRMLYDSQKYANEIEEYKEKVKKYSLKFDIQTQSDIEIIMRVMKDMHKTIRGYGEPKIDAKGYEGMDVMDKDGIGNCSNMAENVADKLNAINPEYNARTISLYANGEDYECANISKNIIEGNIRINEIGNVTQIYINEELSTRTIDYGDTVIISEYKENLVLSKETIYRKVPNEIEERFYDENKKIQVITIIKDGYKTTTSYNEQGIEVESKREKTDKNYTFFNFETVEGKEENKLIETVKKLVGNHKMVAVDLKDEEITLLIDPTWLGLGIYKDGAIHMFNEKQNDEAIYNAKFFGYLKNKGIKTFWEYPIDYVKSFKESTLTLEELEKKYGVEAQNEMLKKIEEEDRKKEQANSFKESVKVDNKGVTYNFDTNTVTLTPSHIKAKEEESQKGH